MDTQTAGYQNKLLGAVVQTDYTDGFVCLRRRLEVPEALRKLFSKFPYKIFVIVLLNIIGL